MVRLLHTSDWHLGRSLFAKSLLEDQAAILDRLIEVIDRVKPHGLLIAGDVFDRQLPPEGAITLFDRFLRDVAGARNLPIFLIPGNHDSAERVSFASELLRHRGLTIFGRISDAFKPVVLPGDDDSRVEIFGIPFTEPLAIAGYLNDPTLTTPDSATRALCEKILQGRKPGTPSVLLSHSFVRGGESSESERDLFIGGASLVETSAFDGFTYTALGHLHKAQTAGSPRVRYSGSILQYSKSETAHRKSVTEVAISANGEVTTFEHDLIPLRPLRALEGQLQNLLALAQDDPARDDYIIANYTDCGAIVESYLKLRQFYPNLLHVSRKLQHATLNSLEPVSALDRAQQEQLSDLELFKEFFASCTGEKMNTDEEQALTETLRELGFAEGEAR